MLFQEVVVLYVYLLTCVAIGVVTWLCRSQPPDIRLQCNLRHALPPSEDTTRNSERESQQNGYHVRTLALVTSRPASLILTCRGNVLVISSTTSIVIALTWGGVTYPWSSGHVVAPLVVGLIGLGVFGIYEIYFIKPPVVSPLAGTRQK